MAKGKESKIHIGIYGRRNNGKSSFINSITGQDIAIVSDVAGTTTDPVKKSFEISGLGPAILIDTAGIDDSGDLGLKRINKTFQSIQTIDLAILIIAGNVFGRFEEKLINEFDEFDIPWILIHNKEDKEQIRMDLKESLSTKYSKPVHPYSALSTQYRESIIKVIRETIPENAYKQNSLLGNYISYGDVVLLITPIDVEAPAGRLILPQVQAIRDVLDNDAVAIVLKEREVDSFLKNSGIKPKLAITDSQIFAKASGMIPDDIPLTSFSILLASFKGDFVHYLKGTPKISELKSGDKVLLLESCNHHVSCDDIGRVKIPRWISNFTGKDLNYDVVAGLDKLPGKITDYALVIQCGGCMITQKQIQSRLRPAIKAGVAVTNYGMAIAYVQGIYHRAIQVFTGDVDHSSDYL